MTVSIHDAQLRLANLIREGKPGERIAIEDNGRAVASLVVEGQQPANKRPRIRKGGWLKGKIHFLVDENDESHLADFKEYME